MKTLRYLWRKAMLVIVAVMIGFSNVIYEEDNMINAPWDSIENLEETEEDELH